MKEYVCHVPQEFSDNNIHEVNIIADYLYKGTKNDHFFLYISGLGGYDTIGSRLMYAIRYSKCPLTLLIDGSCSSMHALVALTARAKGLPKVRRIFFKGTAIMIHLGSTGIEGEEHVKIQLDTVDSCLKTTKMQHDLLEPNAITSEEEKRMYGGQDVYIYAEDLAKRLKAEYRS